MEQFMNILFEPYFIDIFVMETFGPANVYKRT